MLDAKSESATLRVTQNNDFSLSAALPSVTRQQDLWPTHIVSKYIFKISNELID